MECRIRSRCLIPAGRGVKVLSSLFLAAEYAVVRVRP